MAQTFTPLGIAVVTVSDSRDLASDKSGDFLVASLEAAGHTVSARQLVKDDREQLIELFRALSQRGDVDVILSTGGTGVTRRDVTPDALEAVQTKAIPGFGELFRWLSYEDIGASTIQSRAAAALIDATLCFVLPGSTGAVRLAWDKILSPQLDSRTRPCNFAELLPRIRSEPTPE